MFDNDELVFLPGRSLPGGDLWGDWIDKQHFKSLLPIFEIRTNNYDLCCNLS